MEFTQEQITEIISEITNGEEGLQGLVKQGVENLIDSIPESVTLFWADKNGSELSANDCRTFQFCKLHKYLVFSWV